jgi:membrane fusion protein (multidrug efflux system)
MTPLSSLPRKKSLVWVYWGGVALLGLIGFLYWLFYWKDRAYTDDAYVQGNQVMLTPLIPGFVQAILTDDTYLVKKGQLIVKLDDTNAKIAFQSAQDRLAEQVRMVCQNFHEVFALHAEVGSRKAEFIKTAQDYEHRNFVLEAGGVSVEDFEHAEAALRSAFFHLHMSEVLLEKAYSLVQGTSITTHPSVLLAASQARQAWVDLYRCNIYSPVEGLVAQRTIQVGMWVPSGHPMMAIIPLDQIWVNANFKETQMKRMRIGQPVQITSDLYGYETKFHGRIAGLPGGAGNAFSILPPQNLSGNWIKIVQRLPVRVELEESELRQHPLRIGLSMEAIVNLKEPGALVPTSTKGSPNYLTDIFTKEEEGDLSWIDEIIKTNLDPSLEEYAQNILVLPENIDE